MEQRMPNMEDGLERLWSLERQRAQLYRERYQSLLLEYDTAGSNQKATDGEGDANTSAPNSENSPY
jgi:hypothetical protein